MRVSPEEQLKDGYLILRGVVPPSELEALRASAEAVIQRRPKYPGLRIKFDDFIEPDTANLVEFCLHENTLGVSRQLLKGSDVAVNFMAMLTNPLADVGPADWHRDYTTDYNDGKLPPLADLLFDLLANGPTSVQWNIPLYDDNVLWVVPGSHSRINTPEEDRQLKKDPRVPIPGGIPVELAAGDAVVYNNLPILHWGSNYSTALRRTIHLVYRSFETSMFPWVWQRYWDLTVTKHLSPSTRAAFESWDVLYSRERDRIGTCLRDILSGDAAAFRASLAELHPGHEGRIVCVMLLARFAYKILCLKDPSLSELSLTDRTSVLGEGPFPQIAAQYDDLARRFSVPEAVRLWQRFAVLDVRLSFDSKLQSVKRSGHAPEGADFGAFSSRFGVEDFIASWH